MAGLTMTMGSGVVDSIFGKSQEPIRMFLEKRGEQFEQRSALKNLFHMGTTDKFGDKLTTMTAFDGFKPVGENGAYPTDSYQEGFSKFIEQMTWKDSFSISQELVEDSNLISFRQRPEAFISGFYRTRENFGAALFGAAIQGQSTATYAGKSFDATCADGKPLFAQDHPEKVKGTTQSNIFKDKFSNAALGQLETIMQNFEGDNGELLDVTPDTIVIPNLYDLKNEVFAAIGADKDPDTSNNGFNYNFGRWNVIVWPYLNSYVTGTNVPWMLIDSRYNETYGGAVWLDRVQLNVKSDIDPNTDANIFKGRARFSAAFNDFRFAAAAGITTASEM